LTVAGVGIEGDRYATGRGSGLNCEILDGGIRKRRHEQDAFRHRRARRHHPGHGGAARPGPPAAYPFTRRIFPDGYRGRPWTIRQCSGFGSAEESNERYRFLLREGQTGLSVALDLPTQCGDDPPTIRSRGPR